MMHRLSLIAALSAAVLTGCQSVPTADEIDRMQAPDAHASHAKNLMKVFAFDMHDREDAGRGRAVTVTPEEAAAPGVDLLTSGGSGFFNGMLEKSVMAADPLETVHYFGFVPVTEAADERAVVRHVAAKTVQAVAVCEGGLALCMDEPQGRPEKLRLHGHAGRLLREGGHGLQDSRRDLHA